MFGSMMVFGSGNKFRIRRSQSKASSYLSYRRDQRDKEKGLPNFQGSYKRTMSPSGGRIIETSDVSDKEVEVLKELSPSPESILEDSQGKEGKDLAKSLARNFSSVSASAVVVPTTKRVSRPPRAASDPTTSAVLLEVKSTKQEEDKSVDTSRLSESCSEEKRKEESREAALERISELCRVDSTQRVAESQAEELKGASEPATTLRASESVTSLRVSDASSQTTPAPSPPPPSQLPPRRQLQEEIDCEQLSRHLASQLSPSHKLHNLLAPGPEVKRSTDYVSGLFRMDLAPRSRSSPVTLPDSKSPEPDSKEKEASSGDESNFTTECKARLMSIVSSTQLESFTSMGSLQQKKEELVTRLSQKLLVLRSEAVAVTEETKVNDALGATVGERVERLARPHEASKFRLHVREVGHITSLLLGLSGRLARVENTLLTLPPDKEEDKKTLEGKRDKLLSQLSEAKKLKENIDKRSESVSSMLYNYLTGEEYTDYDHFISMKSKLLVDSREIAEKILLGEEQLAALKETLDQVR